MPNRPSLDAKWNKILTGVVGTLGSILIGIIGYFGHTVHENIEELKNTLEVRTREFDRHFADLEIADNDLERNQHYLGEDVQNLISLIQQDLQLKTPGKN